MKYLFWIVLLTRVPLALAQNINFEKVTVVQAFDKAKLFGRPLLVEVTTDWCKPCQERREKKFTDPSIIFFLNTHFTTKMINAEVGEGIEFALNYKVSNFPSLLIFAPTGDLIFRHEGTTGSTASYLALLNIGLIESTKPSLNTQLQSLSIETVSKDSLGDILTRAAKLNIDHPKLPFASLAYFSKLTEEEKSTASRIFPLSMLLKQAEGPVYAQVIGILKGLKRIAKQRSQDLYTTLMNAIQYSVEHGVTDKEKFNHLLAEAREINITFNHETPAEVELTDVMLRLAYTRAGAAGVLGKKAETYVEKYLMLSKAQLNKEDLRIWNAKSNQVTLGYTKKEMDKPGNRLPNRHMHVETFTTAKRLNNIAWEYFLIQNKETNLAKAQLWANRATQLYPHPNMLDTKANLMFAQNKIEPAIEIQRHAIKQMQQIGGDTSELHESLQKMKRAYKMTSTKYK